MVFIGDCYLPFSLSVHRAQRKAVLYRSTMPCFCEAYNDTFFSTNNRCKPMPGYLSIVVFPFERAMNLEPQIRLLGDAP